MATKKDEEQQSGLTSAYLKAVNAALPGVALLSPLNSVLNQPAVPSATAPSTGVVTQTGGKINLTPGANLKVVADAQRQYAEGVQAGTIPALASQGGPAFPSLTNTFPTGELYPGQRLTEAKLAAFDQQPAITAAAQPATGVNQDLTTALMNTALGRTAQQGNGIDFGAGDLNRANAGVANPFAQQFSNLLGQVTALANTKPEGSDSFVDFFQKAAARRRGQEGLVKLAELAGQAQTTQAGQQLQAQTEQARLAQAGQESQQRNALLAGQTLLQAQTSLAEKNAALEAAKAKTAAEAPKTQAETAKLLGEVQQQQLINNLNQSIAAAAASGQPVPQNLLNLGQFFRTGQAVQPTGVETKVVTDAQGNQSLVTLNKQTGGVINAGTPGQLIEEQQAKSSLTANPGQLYRSALNPSLVYYIDPATKTMTSGTLQQYAAAVGGK